MERASLREPGRLGMCCHPDESFRARFRSRERLSAVSIVAAPESFPPDSKTGSAKITTPSVGGGLLAAAFLKLASTEAEGKRLSSYSSPNSVDCLNPCATGKAANGMYCK